MPSKRRLEGYLYAENRHAPPVPDAMIDAARRAGKTVVNTGTGVFERNTLTCAHCQLQLIVNPDRTRARAWCRNCDRYICDACEYTAGTNAFGTGQFVHMPAARRFDNAMREAIRAEARGRI